MYDTICWLQPHMIQIWFQSCVQYDLAVLTVYNINLRATNTTILSTRGVTIPIWFVSGTTDSIRRRVVLFKPVTIPTSDPKSEFLCQSSSIVQNLQTPLKSPRTPGISPTPSSPRITLTPTNQVLLPSTSSRNYTFSMLNVLVTVSQILPWHLPTRSARGCKTFKSEDKEYWQERRPKKPKKTHGSVGW